MGTGADSTIVSGLRDSTPADASGAQSFAGGDAAVASGASSVAIGDSSSATGSASIAILANSTSDGAINILGSSVGVDSVSIGNAASSTDDGVAIGPGTLASVDAVGIGHSTIANSSQSIALGPANALEDDAVAISGTVHVGATKGIALGRSSDVAAATAMALGANSSASGIASTAIGYLAATSADNQIMLGTSAEEVYFPGTAPLWIPQGASAGYVLTSDAAGHGTWQAGGGGGGVTGFAAPNLTLGTSNAAGSATTVLATDATILAFDATTPATETVGNAGAVGTAGTAARRDHLHPMPNVFVASGASHATGFVPDPGASSGTTKFLREDATWAVPPGGAGVTFGIPAFTFDTTDTAGSTDEAVRRDAQIALFDATAPTTQAFGDSAAAGSAGKAARRDHKHAWPTAAVTTSGLTQATGKLLGRSTAGTGAIEEITLGTNLSFSGTTLNAAGGSGAVATDTIWDAKGDLAVGTGADTAAKLTVGANGTILVPDSTQSTGLKWFTPSYADVYRNSAQNLTSGGFTQVNYDTVSNQSADNPWDNTNHNFKCPIAGRYLITAVVGFNPAVALTSTAALSLYVNGSEQKRGLQVQTGTWSSFVSSFQYTAAANDTLDIRVFHAQGVNVPVATGAGTIHAEFAYIGPT